MPPPPVLFLPELLGLVCRYSSKADAASLSQTCRTLFSGAMPHVWETVLGVHNLFALLPNVVISKPHHQNHNTVRSITFRPSDNAPFTRFDVYAPHIKHLDAFGASGDRVEIEGWGLMSERAQQQPLLPNLLSISFRVGFVRSSMLEFDWIADFISSSLTSLTFELKDTTEKTRPMPEFDFLGLLDPVVERCNTLQRLAIYPKAGSYACSHLPAIFGSSSFRHLRELSGSAALVETDLIQVIGSLPHLESLVIRAFNQFLPPLPERLSDASFPALKRLAFTTIWRRDVFSLAQLHPMLSGLESLTICFDPFVAGDISDEPDLEEFDDEIEAAAYSVVNSWLQATPNLKELYIDFDPDRNGYQSGHCDDELLKLVAGLQIRLLTLRTAVVPPLFFDKDTFNWSHLLVLRLPSHVLNVETLLVFCSIPNLEILEACIQLADTVEVPPITTPNRSLHTLESSDELSITTLFQDVHRLARMLLSMWTNLQRVRWHNVVDAEEEGCARVNKCLAALRNNPTGLVL